jgi:hypothetical protein
MEISRIKRHLLVIMSLLVFLPLFSLNPGSTLASASHENTNPYTTGCMSGASAIASKAVSGGTVSIMESKACSTNWVQYSGVTQNTTKYGKASDKGWTHTEVDYAAKSWSLQSYAPGTTAYTGVIKIGNTTTTANCSWGCTWSVSTDGSSGSGSGSSLDTRVANFVNATRYTTVGDGECVSMVKSYLSQVWGISPGAWGNAIDYRSGGYGGNQLAAQGFSWSTSQSFQNGDILVWGPSASGGTGSLGHIGIWYNGTVYDQNDARHSPARTANYSNFWSGGFLGRWRK